MCEPTTTGQKIFSTVLITVWISFVIFAIIAVYIQSNWQSEAIEKGFAEYNQTTGDWQWKEVTK